MVSIVKMPSLSPTMKDGKIVEWKKKDGDQIASGDILVTIETDKAVMELDSVDEGILAGIVYPNNTDGVVVGQPIAYLLEEGETAEDVRKLRNASPKETPKSAPSENAKLQAACDAPSPPKCQKSQERIFITPLARRLAQQHGVDIARIEGTGPHGRIRKQDVENMMARTGGRAKPQRSLEPLSRMRQAIGQSLLESKITIPHFYIDMDVDVTAAEEVKKTFKNQKRPVTLHHIIMRAVALALQDCPYINVQKEGDSIRFLESSDVSFALSLDGGLVTPIVPDAHTKSLFVIAEEVKKLSQKGRAGMLAPHEFQGGSICVTNLGMYGVKSFSAIINPPQASILAVGAARSFPYVKNGLLGEKRLMNCTLSADHRLVDGVVAAEFLQCIKEYLEAPILLTI